MKIEDVAEFQKYRLKGVRVFEYFDDNKHSSRQTIKVPEGSEVVALSVIKVPSGVSGIPDQEWESVLCATKSGSRFDGYATALVGAHCLEEIPLTIDDVEVGQVYRMKKGLPFTTEGRNGLLQSYFISGGSVVSVRAKIGDLVVMEATDPETENLVYHIGSPDKLHKLPLPEGE